MSQEELSPFYISAPGASYRPHVLKQADAFAVLDVNGAAQAAGPAAEGLFFEDTRYLSQCFFMINGLRPLLLSSSVDEENTVLSVDMTNPDLAEGPRIHLVKDTIHILKCVVLGEDVLFQTLDLRNFGSNPVELRLEFRFDCDFADMFEVRGTPRARRGARLPDERLPDGIAIGYRGLDRVVRRARIVFSPAAELVDPRKAAWSVRLDPASAQRVEIGVHCERDGQSGARGDRQSAVAKITAMRSQRRCRTADVYTSNESFNNWLNRSRADLDMLTTETPHGLYAYAGIPWFSTPFGRDGIITALECLWLDPALAAGTLRFLAATQAKELDPRADAEPGKILHETRKGEMAALGEVPFGKYYGSVDSTPLFVVLAAAYYARTGELALVREIWPAMLAAMEWIETFGDPDGDGFLEYDRRSVNGLTNQGWKDSADSIFHADGSLADAPIALAEVQAYAYDAFIGAATLAAALGENGREEAWSAAAQRLRARFHEAFWLPELGTYALALDGRKEPCRVRSSNAGQVLLSGLPQDGVAESVAACLMQPASFSNWGIRTVAEGEARYNPLSYHNGSVWPHDNALIALGFARHGLREPLLKTFSALFDASLFLELNRLPELFCGFSRRPGTGPTRYPVACIPQAWSSAAVFGLLGAALGISFEAPERCIRFTRPVLPDWLDECRLSNLKLGDATVDLMLRRNREDVALNVIRRHGDVEISVTL